MAAAALRAASAPLDEQDGPQEKYASSMDRAQSMPAPDERLPAVAGNALNGNWGQLGRASPPGSHLGKASAFARNSQNIAEKWGSFSTVSDAVTDRIGCRTLNDLCGGLYVPKERLKIVRVLGEGAYAEVAIAEYLASIPENGEGATPAEPQLVAVKTLKPSIVDSEDDVVDFIDEMRLLVHLRHNNIVRFIGMGCLDSSSQESGWRTVFMVQEYMSGGTLKSTLLKQMVNITKPIYSYSEALRWCINVADALANMHGSRPKVIHRDLKSENILLTVAENGQRIAKIADFGLHALIATTSMRSDNSMRGGRNGLYISAQTAATAYSGRQSPHHRFAAHVPINPTKLHHTAAQEDAEPSAHGNSYNMTGKTGAFCYMAPEVLMGQPYNESVDVFSFGIILFELFSRRLMSADLMNTTEWDESEGHAYKVAAGYRPPLGAHIPQPLRDLIDACWSGRSELRPKMVEVVQRLQAMQGAGVAGEMDAKAPSAAGGACCSVM